MNQETNNNMKFTRYLLGGFIAGVASAIANNLYNIIFKSLTGIEVSDFINYGTITSTSMVLPILAAIYYFVLNRTTRKACVIFTSTTILIVLLSLLGPLQEQLPNGEPAPSGWVGLTIPMHIITGLFAFLSIHKYIHKNDLPKESK